MGAGGEDPTEGFKNLAINGISVLVLSFLLNRDLQTSARDRAIVKREEALARLQACPRHIDEEYEISEINSKLISYSLSRPSRALQIAGRQNTEVYS